MGTSPRFGLLFHRQSRPTDDWVSIRNCHATRAARERERAHFTDRASNATTRRKVPSTNDTSSASAFHSRHRVVCRLPVWVRMADQRCERHCPESRTRRHEDCGYDSILFQVGRSTESSRLSRKILACSATQAGDVRPCRLHSDVRENPSRVIPQGCVGGSSQHRLDHDRRPRVLGYGCDREPAHRHALHGSDRSTGRAVGSILRRSGLCSDKGRFDDRPLLLAN